MENSKTAPVQKVKFSCGNVNSNRNFRLGSVYTAKVYASKRRTYVLIEDEVSVIAELYKPKQVYEVNTEIRVKIAALGLKGDILVEKI